MQSPTLSQRIGSRIVRDVKYWFGVELFLYTEDRRILEQRIFPYFLHRTSCKDILFVGCHWCTRGYNGLFQNEKNFWTLEVSPARAKYGATQHIIDKFENLTKHFAPESLDLILCNGVYDWGLSTGADAEVAFTGCVACLRPGGVPGTWMGRHRGAPSISAQCV